MVNCLSACQKESFANYWPRRHFRRKQMLIPLFPSAVLLLYVGHQEKKQRLYVPKSGKKLGNSVLLIKLGWKQRWLSCCIKVRCVSLSEGNNTVSFGSMNLMDCLWNDSPTKSLKRTFIIVIISLYCYRSPVPFLACIGGFFDNMLSQLIIKNLFEAARKLNTKSIAILVGDKHNWSKNQSI